MKEIKQAVILAGGMGKRLRPMTIHTPKPMLQFHGKPFLEYLIDELKLNGINEVILLVGYLHEQIENYFKDGNRLGLSIKYSYDPVEVDTGARVRNAFSFLDKRFLLLYGDNYWPLKLDVMTRIFNKLDKKALVTVYTNLDRTTKNNMYVNQEGMVEMYDRNRKIDRLNAVDIGFFILNRDIFKGITTSNFSFEDKILTRLINEGQLGAYKTDHKYYGLSNKDRIPIIEEYFTHKKTIFLDRDGVINIRPAKTQYITKWKDFVFLPGVKEALKMLQDKGYTMYIVSNQAGIARGIMTQRDVDEINRLMIDELKKSGVNITDVFVCPHHWSAGCFCRKPKPGLFFEASYIHHLNLYQSYCLGDDISDIQAGKAAGCLTIYLTDNSKSIEFSDKPNFIYKNLREAALHL